MRDGPGTTERLTRVDGRAAAVLREARHRAGLTQVELAERAGVHQSVISVYESGRRQPSLPVLTALVEAAGLELDIVVQPVPEHLAGLTGPGGRQIRRLRTRIVAAVAARGGFSVSVTGAAATGMDGRGRLDGPIEFLVSMPAGGLVGLELLRADLETLLGHRVELTVADEFPATKATHPAPTVPLNEADDGAYESATDDRHDGATHDGHDGARDDGPRQRDR